MGILKDFIMPEEDEEEVEVPSTDIEPITKNSANIVLFEPCNFDEAEEIGMHIKNRRACCINLHKMPLEYRQRIIDFLSGVIYGVDGSIKKVGEGVILCSPKNLTVAGDIDLHAKPEEQ